MSGDDLRAVGLRSMIYGEPPLRKHLSLAGARRIAAPDVNGNFSGRVGVADDESFVIRMLKPCCRCKREHKGDEKKARFFL